LRARSNHTVSGHERGGRRGSDRQGDGPGRLCIVEPTGPFVDGPDLTDKRFPGNPTRSYRSRDPLRVVGEVCDASDKRIELTLQALP
jgi:hypothetical protein